MSPRHVSGPAPESVDAYFKRQDAVQAILGVLNDIGGGNPWNYNVITEAAEDAWDAAVRAYGLDSFNGLMAAAQMYLDERFPADISLLCDRDSPDPGPRLAAAMRDCLAAMEKRG